MKAINKNTKRGQSFINAFLNSSDIFLSDVYTTPSVNKQEAYTDSRRMFGKENGADFRIISFNTFAFSVAWKTADGLRIETASNSYIVK